MPTILEVTGIQMPDEFGGVKQYPINGVSMRYSFDNADTPTTKKRQYYAMLGTRGIWENGWKAASLHAAISNQGHFDQDKWELYHVDEDRSESKNLADQYPDKLEELINVWNQEAQDNYVLPLDDRSVVEQLGVERPKPEPPRDRYVYHPGASPVPDAAAVNVCGRSYKIVANVDLTPEARGVIFAHGSRFGGHTLFVKDRRLHYVYNFLGIQPEQDFVASALLPPGQTHSRHGIQPRNLWATRRIRRYHNAVRRRPTRQQGPDARPTRQVRPRRRGTQYRLRQWRHHLPAIPEPATFTGGTIQNVTVEIGKESFNDLQKEAEAVLEGN